jgi:23S rRNA (cytidine1920-2'-O)/16S rRNA (cytidine1409-2'-O)-methyltransferase
MKSLRLDQALVVLGLVPTRSQAASYIRLGKVSVNKKIITKPGYMVSNSNLDKVTFKAGEQYVSRAALKLASAATALNLNFKDKTVLDVGSSTGGFTDYSLKHGAEKVIAVDSGTDQLHDSLRGNPKIELHEKTDIRDFKTTVHIDIVLIDVSFISLRKVLPAVKQLVDRQTQILAMVKPQFEAGDSEVKHKGVIKNDQMRRQILKDFEAWASNYFVVNAKADSAVSGAKGNLERFYDLRKA